MSKYEIQPYTYKQAEKLNVKITPSKYPNKIIDVYDVNSNYLFSVGSSKYMDYPTYLAMNGKKYAEDRRRLYHIRHKKDASIIGSAGYYAANLLW